MRSEAGERLVLQENIFVEKVLPAGTLRSYTPAEMESYRAPFREPGEGRRPTLTWPREIPIGGAPPDVTRTVAVNAAFMSRTAIPKLFVNGDPGALLIGASREQCRRWPRQQEVTVPGLHFLPEDSASRISEALHEWLLHLP